MTSSTNAPLVSFIIPVRNGEASILKCLTSILNQKTKIKFEVIAVDNASSDNSFEIIKHLNITLIHEPQVGRSLARNAGLNISKGEWVSFIDCDVELQDNWLEEIYRNLITNDLFDGGQGKITPAGYQSSLFEEYRYELIEFQTQKTFCHLEAVKLYPSINSASCVYRRRRLIEVGGFDPILNAYEDIDLCWRLWVTGSSFVSVPTANSYVYWDKGKFLSYMIRYFHMGKGSFVLNLLWREKFMIPQLKSQFFKSKNFSLRIFDVLRILAFSLGITVAYIFRSKWTRAGSQMQPMRQVILSRPRKYLYTIADKRYLMLLSPSTRIVCTSKHAVVADLKFRKYLYFTHNFSFNDQAFLHELLWRNKTELIREYMLDIFENNSTSRDRAKS